MDGFKPEAATVPRFEFFQSPLKCSHKKEKTLVIVVVVIVVVIKGTHGGHQLGVGPATFLPAVSDTPGKESDLKLKVLG